MLVIAEVTVISRGWEIGFVLHKRCCFVRAGSFLVNLRCEMRGCLIRLVCADFGVLGDWLCFLVVEGVVCVRKCLLELRLDSLAGVGKLALFCIKGIVLCAHSSATAEK